MTSPRIALFALTGFGNTVLPALCAAGLRPELLVTRAETGPFPYYDEERLTAVAERLGVPCFFGIKGEQKVAANPPDILLCATYHRLLSASILDNIRWAINLHPSLLPRYRGANPFYWVIRNGEASTGVTAHIMTDAADAGSILRQEAIDISITETQGSLRRRLASLAAKMAVESVRGVLGGMITPAAQDETKATVFDRPSDAERKLSEAWSVAETERAIRALSPFPGLITDAGIVTELVGQGSTERSEIGLYQLRLYDGDLVIRLKPA